MKTILLWLLGRLVTPEMLLVFINTLADYWKRYAVQTATDLDDKAVEAFRTFGTGHAVQLAEERNTLIRRW